MGSCVRQQKSILILKKLLNKIKTFDYCSVSRRKLHNYHLGYYLSSKYYKEHNTMINVGVNKSLYLIQPSRFYKNVIGFEPDDTFTQIKEDISQFSNIECYNIALSNKEEVRTFYKNSIESGLSSLSTRRSTENTSLVKTRTLDNFLLNKKIEKIDYIKIDAELEDPNIVLGSLNTIKTHLPIIQLETVNNEARTFLFDLGYKRHFFNFKNRGQDKFFVHQSLL